MAKPLGAVTYRKCPVCEKMRKTKTLQRIPVFLPHNKWDAEKQEMVRCEGSGREFREPKND